MDIGWILNVEKDGRQQPDEYFKIRPYEITDFVLYKKFFLCSYYDHYNGKLTQNIYLK
jgi:hypothetical protein